MRPANERLEKIVERRRGKLLDAVHNELDARRTGQRRILRVEQREVVGVEFGGKLGKRSVGVRRCELRADLGDECGERRCQVGALHGAHRDAHRVAGVLLHEVGYPFVGGTAAGCV